MAANNKLLLRGVLVNGVSQVRAFIQGIKDPEHMAVTSNVITKSTTRDELKKSTIF